MIIITEMIYGKISRIFINVTLNGVRRIFYKIFQDNLKNLETNYSFLFLKELLG